MASTALESAVEEAAGGGRGAGLEDVQARACGPGGQSEGRHGDLAVKGEPSRVTVGGGIVECPGA